MEAVILTSRLVLLGTFALYLPPPNDFKFHPGAETLTSEAANPGTEIDMGLSIPL